MENLLNLNNVQDNIVIGEFSKFQFLRFMKVLSHMGNENYEIENHLTLAESIYYLLEKCVDYYKEGYERFCELYQNMELLLSYLAQNLSCQVYRVDNHFVTVFMPKKAC